MLLTTSHNKPFLRWVGCKRKLVKKLSEYAVFCAYDRYVEPFAGSAAMFFYLNPDIAIINDINASLMEVYLVVRDSLDELYDEIIHFKADKDDYYRLRTFNPVALNDIKRAARFIYLNRYCFNGLYRTNKNGDFNVPYGGGKTGRIPSYEAFKKCRDLLRSAEIKSCDFQEVLKNVKKNDLIYLDPPYHLSRKRIFKEYDSNVFYSGDIKRLRWWVEYFNENNISFIMSYLQSDEAEYLSKGCNVEVVNIKRTVAANPSMRKLVKEIIITNI